MKNLTSTNPTFSKKKIITRLKFFSILFYGSKIGVLFPNQIEKKNVFREIDFVFVTLNISHFMMSLVKIYKIINKISKL